MARRARPVRPRPKSATPETDAPKPDAPETDAPETDAPATDAPETGGPAVGPDIARRFRRCILHIGTEKTGSTSVQSFLGLNREALLQAGLFVPRALVPPDVHDTGKMNHIFLATISADSEADLHGLLGHTGLSGPDALRLHRRQVAMDFKAELERVPASADTLVLSCEYLHSRITTPQAVARLHAFLAPYCETVTVLVYLRPQHEISRSIAGMAIRQGTPTLRLVPEFDGPGGFDTVLGVRRQYFDYADLIERYAAAFGDSAMKPRIFGSRSDTGPDSAAGDVVADFASVIGIDIGQYPTPLRENSNVSPATQYALLTLNQERHRLGHGADPPFEELIRGWLADLPHGAGALPARSAIAELMQSFAESNEAVRQRWFPGRPKLFAESLNRYPERQTSLADHAEEGAQLLAALVLYLHQQTRPKALAAPAASGAEIEAPKGFLEIYNRSKIGGWVVTPGGVPQVRVTIDGDELPDVTVAQTRPDVHPEAMGFEVAVPPDYAAREDVLIAVTLGSDAIPIGNSPVRAQFGRENRDDVLAGRNGRLFLQNDADRTIEQLTGRLVPEADWLRLWRGFLAEAAQSGARHGARLQLLVVPAKGVTDAPDLPLGVVLSDSRPVVQLLAAAAAQEPPGVGCLYPIDAIRRMAAEAGLPIYPPAASDLSDFGVAALLEACWPSVVLPEHGVWPAFTDESFVAAYRTSDLRSWLGGVSVEKRPVIERRFQIQALPMPAFDVAAFDVPALDMPAFDMSAAACVESRDPRAAGRLLVLHDPMMASLVPPLAERFAWTCSLIASDLDERVIAAARPDVILLVLQESAIIRVPRLG